jgi:hypothetical protein
MAARLGKRLKSFPLYHRSAPHSILKTQIAYTSAVLGMVFGKDVLIEFAPANITVDYFPFLCLRGRKRMSDSNFEQQIG